MIEWFRICSNLTMIALSMGLSYYGYRLLNIFKGGMFESSFKILAPLPLIIVVFQIFDLLQHVLIKTSTEETFYLSSQLLHIVSGFLFVSLLFYVLHLFYKTWDKMSPK